MRANPATGVVIVDGGTLRLSGRVGYANAGTLLPMGSKALAGGKVGQIDLAGLEGSDSATLAVLLAWAAEASRYKRQLVMSGAPEGLRALARLANAEELLGLS